MSVAVRGQVDIRRAAAQLREEARRLQFNVNDRVAKESRGFKAVVAAGAGLFVPDRYAGVLGPAVRVQTVRRAAGIRLRVSAKGRKELRDLDAVDSGVLRHKVFGNPKVWVTQRVTAGVVERPFNQWLKPRIESGLADNLDELRDRLERG